MITYAIEPDLSANEFLALLAASTLAERRPVDQPQRIAKMLAGSDLIVTARDAVGHLVGVARSVTDFAYCLYCSDLAVDRRYQGRGIGKALLRETVKAVPEVRTHLLLSAPGAMSFYEAAGYEKAGNCFIFHRGE
ncbi:GNAT family N-acetyltransferase [Celeribacter persicus]|uniref:Acetyltransferase (GNAT) family protein n=1 Tax=Celeribacter persicus TaxID=1651082 RepID=A0A2T5HU25_9RHOB|nr:GNAT family N-acetyltransferase [Celeribacter persicus]PTQ75099.1 acetyltransferase (GNAT) family protein [Celeribacter persicus]